ncbi:MAG: hypothetical protein ACREM8_12185 [Vulcanimicrobiaceae bacterium]
MRTGFTAVAAAFALFTIAFVAPIASQAASTFTGSVVHVSTQNIKVHSNAKNKTESFLLVPHFDQVFDTDGKATFQMAKLKPGMRVKVYYDEHLLGARHANKIVLQK